MVTLRVGAPANRGGKLVPPVTVVLPLAMVLLSMGSVTQANHRLKILNGTF